MTRRLQGRTTISWLAGALFLSSMASAQQKTQSAAPGSSYEVSREVSVQGSVIRYSESSATAPFGAHVTVQTASRVLDVHLGDARLLESEHFTLAAGDAIRVIGENVGLATGEQFVARLIQKGNQALALRSAAGLPLRPMAARNSKPAAGVL